jgi:hypothetical protein
MLLPTERTAPPFPAIRLTIVFIVALVVCLLVSTHTSDINGPWYWKWPWQRVPLQRYWVMLLPAIPFAAAQWFNARRSIALGLLVLCAIQLSFTNTVLRDEHFGLGWLAATVRDPIIIGYYSDAAGIGQDPHWLADYPEILPLTHLHTRSKPPGPVAYYLAWIRLMGYGNGSANMAGLGIIVLQSLTVPLVYFLTRSVTQDSAAGFAAASFVSLCPGAVLLAPLLDPVYAGWTCLILWTWERSLRSNSAALALMCGILAAAGLFCSYSLATLGLFAALQAVCIGCQPGAARAIRMIPRLVLAAIAGLAGFYLVLWTCTFFDPITTFGVAWRDQQQYLLQTPRPYPASILFDLTDFALAMSWVGAAIALMGISRAAGDRSMDVRKRWLLAACIIQPMCVAVIGVLQSETLRVWNFMLPLMALAAGIELAAWPPPARASAYAAMFVTLLAIGHNLQLGAGERWSIGR